MVTFPIQLSNETVDALVEVEELIKAANPGRTVTHEDVIRLLIRTHAVARSLFV